MGYLQLTRAVTFQVADCAHVLSPFKGVAAESRYERAAVMRGPEYRIGPCSLNELAPLPR